MKTLVLLFIAATVFCGFSGVINRLDTLQASLIVMHEQSKPIREPGLQ